MQFYFTKEAQFVCGERMFRMARWHTQISAAGGPACIPALTKKPSNIPIQTCIVFMLDYNESHSVTTGFCFVALSRQFQVFSGFLSMYTQCAYGYQPLISFSFCHVCAEYTPEPPYGFDRLFLGRTATFYNLFPLDQ